MRRERAWRPGARRVRRRTADASTGVSTKHSWVGGRARRPALVKMSAGNRGAVKASMTCQGTRSVHGGHERATAHSTESVQRARRRPEAQTFAPASVGYVSGGVSLVGAGSHGRRQWAKTLPASASATQDCACNQASAGREACEGRAPYHPGQTRYPSQSVPRKSRSRARRKDPSSRLPADAMAYVRSPNRRYCISFLVLKHNLIEIIEPLRYPECTA